MSDESVTERDAEGTPEVVNGLDGLRAELEQARAQAVEYLDGWQRARAEFANYKRRVEAERSEAGFHSATNLLARLLPIVDDLDRAMLERPKAWPTEGELGQWAEGIVLIHRKLQNLLDVEGVSPIATEGATFDPALHEAVTLEADSGHEPGEIVGEVRKGYRIRDRVLRPALVRVAK